MPDPRRHGRRAGMKQEEEPLRTLRSEGAERRERDHKKQLKRMVPLLVFALVVVLIARQEIPAVDNWISRILDPAAFEAGEACRHAARNATDAPGFARMLKPGEVEKTAAGFHVSDIEYALLHESGKELHYRFSCNVDTAGEVLAIHREPADTVGARTGQGTGPQQTH